MASPYLALVTLLLLLAGDNIHWSWYALAVLWGMVTVLAFLREIRQVKENHETY